jgi:imidazolonepropionase
VSVLTTKRSSDFLIDGIGALYTLAGTARAPRRGAELRDPGLVKDAAIALLGDEIVAVGPRNHVYDSIELTKSATRLDAGGRAVIPGFVDPHTHAVFDEPRSGEFGRRLTGESYVSIAQSGGGIRASVREFRECSEEELREKTLRRLRSMQRLGTTTVEIKSGYGLNLESELKALRVIASLRGIEDLPRIATTCLAAHEIPDEYREDRARYLSLVCDEILPRVRAEELAERVDVFCEPHVFDLAESRRVLARGKELGFRLTVHADEIEASGGAELAAELGADSADHLGRISAAGIEALAASDTVGVLLPATIFSLGLRNWAPARRLIEAGAVVALATDFNPGSNYCESMPLTLAIACTQLGLHPHEALCMATANAAWALRRADSVGSLECGKKADIVVLEGPSIDRLCHHLGQEPMRWVIQGGRIVHESPPG